MLNIKTAQHIFFWLRVTKYLHFFITVFLKHYIFMFPAFYFTDSAAQYLKKGLLYKLLHNIYNLKN